MRRIVWLIATVALLSSCGTKVRQEITRSTPLSVKTEKPAEEPAKQAQAPAPPKVISEPAPAPAVRTEPDPPKPQLAGLIGKLEDAFFDYDRSSLRSDAQSALRSDVETLKLIFKDFPDTRFTVEGHCDERGSAEYNMGLGDLRARAARDFLVEFGVPADRLVVISFGKERPQCTDSLETCWKKNRRAHLASSHP